MTTEIFYTLDQLQFTRLLLPRLIPEYLILQVKGRTFTPEQFYQYIEECVDTSNPFSLVYAIVDPEKTIVGYFWIEINALDGTLFLSTYSIDKKYWHQGEAIHKAIEFLKGQLSRLKVTEVIWMTTNPRFYEKLGFKRSRNVAMCHHEL